jgi:GDP-L-fucose synthase
MTDFLRNKKVLVTGGSGFLGTHYINELVSRGANVRVTINKTPLQISDGIFDKIEIIEDCDLKNIDNCLLATKDIDYVIHSAGNILHPSTVRTDVQTTLSQIIIISNLLEASYKNGVKRFLDFNSSTGYPNRNYAVTEEEYWDDEPYVSYYGYGWMRRYREKIMQHISNISDMEIIIARGSAVFGPYDNFDLKTCHVVPALIKRVLSGEDPFVVWGSPDVVRDFMYVKDVVNANLLLLEKGESMSPVNVGYGEATTIGEIVDGILKVTRLSPKVEWDNSKPTTIPFRMVDTTKLKNIGFTPQYTFEDGIRETINWFKANEK